MAKSKSIQKAERESLNIKDRLLNTMKISLPEVFCEGKVSWDKIRQTLGEHLETTVDKFNFMWAGKSAAITNVLIPSKATLRPAKKESVKFDESENLFIEGDNLEVLKLLQKSYFEQIKMIYIDPPYNTGNDFVYNDDFRQPLKNYLEQSGQVDNEGNRLSTNTQASGRFHSDWLTMMYPRLKLAWNLLRHDGVIFVSIDDNEVHHLRMMMNEIFGEENFIAQIVVKSNPRGSMSPELIAMLHEYVIVYAKYKQFAQVIGHELSQEMLEEYKYKDKNDKDFRLLGLRQRGGFWRRTERPLLYYPLFVDPKKGSVSLIKDKNHKLEVYPIQPTTGEEGSWRWGKEKVKKDLGLLVGKEINRKGNGGKEWDVYQIDYLHIEQGEAKRTKAKTIWDEKEINYQNGTTELKEIFGGKQYFDFPKPLALLKNIISMISMNENEYILDFFAGSATTAHVVLTQNHEDGGNRKFILVQMPEPTDTKSEAHKAGYKTIADIAKERIRQVLKGYGDHKPIDDGFKVFKLGKSNYYDNLFEYDPDKSPEENDKAFKDYLNKAQKELFPTKINELDIVYENIIKEGLSLNAKIEEVKIGKSTAYKVSDTERELYISLDEKLSASAIEALTDKEYKEKIFICFDGALSDSDKANLALNVTLKTI